MNKSYATQTCFSCGRFYFYKMIVDEQEGLSEPEKIEIVYQPEAALLWSDITGLIPIIHECFEKITAAQKKIQIAKILAAKDWHEHYQDKSTGRKVLSESGFIEHQHELTTAICLAQVNYDVIFAPKALFTRGDKKFDIFLIRDTVILKADLKSISSKNPDTTSKRIKSGSDQASRVVIHINSDIEKRALIDGLRSGVERKSLIKVILLFYKKGFYRLPKSMISNKAIFKLLK